MTPVWRSPAPGEQSPTHLLRVLAITRKFGLQEAVFERGAQHEERATDQRGYHSPERSERERSGDVRCDAAYVPRMAHVGIRPLSGLHDADLHRLKAELLLATGGGAADAEALFDRALSTAREQGSRSFELRAATSLAGLWREQGKRAEARALLAPLYAWFTEGFDTRDLVEARALLDELGG